MVKIFIQGLKDGADLYFVKPVDLHELALAVRNLARRVQVQSPAGVPAPGRTFELDPLRSQLACLSGAVLELTATELRILEMLARCPGVCVERDAILEHLMQPQDLAAIQRLETVISRLRAKARQSGELLPLRARNGSGYAFLAPLKLTFRTSRSHFSRIRSAAASPVCSQSRMIWSSFRPLAIHSR